MLTSEQIQMMMDELEGAAEESNADRWTDKWAEFEDEVNSPKHYQTDSGLEVIGVIDDFVLDPYSYYQGNVIKYLLRHMNKGKPKQDLQKARWYLNKMIQEWDNE